MKIEKGPKGPEKPKIESLYQFLDFLEKEFGKKVTEKFFKPSLERRAGAYRVIGDCPKAKEDRLDKLKKAEVTPITVAKLNQIIDIESERLETALRQIVLRYPGKLEKNIRKEKEEEKEMLNAMKGKEVVLDGEGHIEVMVKEGE